MRTTLDPKMQNIARKALADGLVRYDEAHGFRGPMRHIEIAGDWGPPLADVPALGDVNALASLAVVLDMNGNDARIGLQPKRDPDGSVNRERVTGTMMQSRPALDARQRSQRTDAGRRRLCRADRRQARPVPAAPDPRGRWRHHRDGPLYRPRLRDGRRLLVRPVRVQPRDTGDAPAGLLVQAVRLRDRAGQRLHAVLRRARRADHHQPWAGHGHVERRRTSRASPAVRIRCATASSTRSTR